MRTSLVGRSLELVESGEFFCELDRGRLDLRYLVVDRDRLLSKALLAVVLGNLCIAPNSLISFGVLCVEIAEHVQRPKIFRVVGDHLFVLTDGRLYLALRQVSL